MTLVTTSEGSTLGADAAAAYEALNVAFTARFGRRLIINSGSRTNAEQEAIFRNSYRNYYIADTSRRWWNGEWWYLRPGFATVAVPGTSNHEDPPGKAADFGSGVQTLGSPEHNWMRLWASAWGWEWTGATFVTIEPWHWEKNLPWASWASSDSTPFDPEEDDMPTADEVVSAMLTRKIQNPAGGPDISVQEALGYAVAGHSHTQAAVGNARDQLARSLPAYVWDFKMLHPLTGGLSTAGAFLSSEPAEHAKTRSEIARIVIGDSTDPDLIAAVEALKDAAGNFNAAEWATIIADEADRRQRERLAE